MAVSELLINKLVKSSVDGDSDKCPTWYHQASDSKVIGQAEPNGNIPLPFAGSRLCTHPKDRTYSF